MINLCQCGCGKPVKAPHRYATRQCYARFQGPTPGLTAIANPRRPTEAQRVRLPLKGPKVVETRESWWVGAPREQWAERCAREARPLVHGLSLKIWSTE